MITLHRPVRLISLQAEGHPLVPADLYRDYPPAVLDLVEYLWGDYRRRADADGLYPIEHAHWDWRNKHDSVEAGRHALVAVEIAGDVQGLMAVARQPRPSVLAPTVGPAVYVDYLETAPGNLRGFGEPRYAGVGTVLLVEAVRVAMEAGFLGRVGLHSLPQAEAFYTRCGMTAVGQDAGYYDLPYFEFADEAAARFMASTEKV